jgi:hypothetical protein
MTGFEHALQLLFVPLFRRGPFALKQAAFEDGASREKTL